MRSREGEESCVACRHGVNPYLPQTMLNLDVRVNGVVTASRIKDQEYFYDIDRYIAWVEICPHTQSEFQRVEDLVEEVRTNYLRHLEPWEAAEMNYADRNPDVIRSKDRMSFRFQTLKPFKLEGDLKNIETDDDLLYQDVNILGKVFIHKDGNATLSWHLLESYYHDTEFNLSLD